MHRVETVTFHLSCLSTYALPPVQLKEVWRHYEHCRHYNLLCSDTPNLHFPPASQLEEVRRRYDTARRRRQREEPRLLAALRQMQVGRRLLC